MNNELEKKAGKFAILMVYIIIIPAFPQKHQMGKGGLSNQGMILTKMERIPKGIRSAFSKSAVAA